jgi:hypothetical protein
MPRHQFIGSILVLVLMVTLAFAQTPLNISYQARLSDYETGDPVPDATYPMEFRFYADSTGGTPVWTENYNLPTINGFFSARLGGMDGMNLDNLGGRVFMEVAVDGEVMIPRAPFQHVPYSAIAQRVMGDIITGEGKMIVTNSNGDSSFSILSDAGTDMVSVKMIHPPEGPSFELSSDGINNQISMKMIHPPEGPAIELMADGLNSINSFKMIEPGDDGTPAFELMANGATDEYTFKMIEPADDDNPAIELRSNMGGSSFKMNRYSHDYGMLFDGISMLVDGITHSSTFRLIEPANDDRPGVEITALGASNTSKLRMLDPSNEQNSILEMNSGIGGEASIYMFNPQPEPPAHILAINSSPSTGASIKMFNPQPEPPADPLLLMNTTELGASLAMTAPMVGGLSADIANPLLRMHTDSNGGSISFFDDAGQYMGVEPTPFTPGGLLLMIDPAIADTTISLFSDGEIVVDNDASNLESRLSPGSLVLQTKPGPTLGPPIFMEATATDAKVGIGTETPEFRFDLKSSGIGDGMRVSGSSGNQLFRIRQNSDGSCETQIADYAGSTRLMLRANGGSYFNGGDVGIGITSPTEALHVVGNIRMVDGHQAAGKVLTSDASGVGTWQSPTVLADAQMQELLNIIEQQNAKIAALENRLNELEQR